MSKIKKITVSNIKAISSLTADFNGCTAIITGGNNKGKSSFLRTLMDRLRGVKPDQVIKAGETEGRYEMELTTGEKLIWSLDAKKDKLTYVSIKNIPSSVTKEIAGHFFPKIFDVDKFLLAGPKEQNKMLQKLVGIDLTDTDKAYKEAYDARTYQNQRVVEEKAKLVYYDPKMAIIGEDEAPIAAQLAGIEAHNLRYTQAMEWRKTKEDKIKVNQQSIVIYNDQCDKEIINIDQQIEALNLRKKTLALSKESNTELVGFDNEKLTSEIEALDLWAATPSVQPKTADDIDELQKTLALVKQKNKDIDDNNKARLQQEAFEKAELLAKAADDEVKQIEANKLEVIKSCPLPEGFMFTDDGITYKGFDFTKEQLSSSGIYIAALKLAALTLGDVQTLHFDASTLDRQSLTEIEAWAKTQNLQLLIERPDFDGGEISYEIIEG